jgi:hypothetical protein
MGRGGREKKGGGDGDGMLDVEWGSSFGHKLIGPDGWRGAEDGVWRKGRERCRKRESRRAHANLQLGQQIPAIIWRSAFTTGKLSGQVLRAFMGGINI